MTVKAALPLNFPNKMRWMGAINSAVTIKRRAKPSRTEQWEAGLDGSNAGCVCAGV